MSSKTVNEEVELKIALEIEEIKRALVEETPIKTGLARASWESHKKGKKFIIENNVDYIENLNNGSSRQAPKFFIERTLLNFGSPKGILVRKINPE
jgi:hypothetical protein